MNTVQITDEELKNLHNGRYYLMCALRELDSVVNPKVLETLKKSFKLIELGLEGPVARSDEIQDAHDEVASQLAKQHGLKTVWSAGVVDFNALCPNAVHNTVVSYMGNFMTVENPTYLNLWKAADELIMKSGDLHHIFVEGFEPTSAPSPGWVLEVLTGS